MPITTDADGSEDVNDFLLRIRELGDQRDKEDEERTKKLEEEILQGRRERQARRAERARSLSPTKDSSSNVGTPGSIRSGRATPMQEQSPQNPSLQSTSPYPSGPEKHLHRTNGATASPTPSNSGGRSREYPQPTPKSEAVASPYPSSAIPLARVGTLSWQQRPSSRDSTGPRLRPVSMLAPENAATKPPDKSLEPSKATDDVLSRSHFAQSLTTRDPAWFRQTPERGSASPAFRKNQTKDLSDVASATSSLPLPGMSRESTSEPEERMSPPPDGIGTSGSLRSNHKYSASASIASNNSLRSPLPTMASQRFEPPSSDTISSLGEDLSAVPTVAMSPSQGRISPERLDRPTSPTKGLGGFVQSAMLKRSDSVSKRWTTQAGPGLSRGNSTASNLSGYGGSRYPLGAITPLPESRSGNISRRGSPTSNSRPTSSHRATNIAPRLGENDNPQAFTLMTDDPIGARSDEKHVRPYTRGSKSPTPPKEVVSPPGSPSKRWSPTKSSWLENAINKPESPKVKLPIPQQPAWMAELNRAKQSKGSVDMGKESKFKEVAIGGLVRSPPPVTGFTPPTVGGLSNGLTANQVSKSRGGNFIEDSPKGPLPINVESKTKTQPVKSGEQPSLNHSKESTPAEPSITPVNPESTTSPKTKSISLELEQKAKPLNSAKTKPDTPPKKDMKSALKSRQTSGEHISKPEPEFRNVFGNLKRTQTKNYVAPDELKNNILRGKAGLAQTGGPKKTERKDEFKESILQKKQGMVPPSASTRITSASSKIQDQSIPEALAKKRELAHAERPPKNANNGLDQQTSKPEALAKAQQHDDNFVPKLSVTNSAAPAIPKSKSVPDGTSVGDFTDSLSGILQRGPPPLDATPTTVSDEIAKAQVLANVDTSTESANGPQLTHMTKTRARGPKRRPPATGSQGPSAEASLSEPNRQAHPVPNDSKVATIMSGPKPQSSRLSSNHVEPRPPSIMDSKNNQNPSQPLSPRKSSTNVTSSLIVSRPTTSIAHGAIEGASSRSPPTMKKKPVLIPKEPVSRQASVSVVESPDTSVKPVHKQGIQSTNVKPSEEPERLETRHQNPDVSPRNVKDAAANWAQSSQPAQSNRARSPIKLPIRRDEDVAHEKAGLREKEVVATSSVKKDKTVQISPNAKSPPLPAKKPSSIASRLVSRTLPPSVTTLPEESPSASSSKITTQFADIFEEPPSSKQRVNINTQAVLDASLSKDCSLKIKTLRKQIVEIIDNGKTIAVPTHQEYLLFDDRVYLCTHVFGNKAGQRTTEIYLWVGNAAPAPISEDAQLFAKKHAKDNGGKLFILDQGKETINFFQALGGIVITRYGSNSRLHSTADSSGGYLLCGRQYVGQIAFDEVPCHPRSLCSGFPYILCASSGKVYLWKGSGSGADELGCARLIGMDLGSASEIEEVEDGREPDSFWEAFAEKGNTTSGGHRTNGQFWHLKPSCENYLTRFFSVNFETQRPKSASGFIQGAMQWGRRGSAPSNDQDAPKTAQIKEIFPFAQSGLQDDGVFVLDAFFEIFVLSILTIRSLAPAPHQKSTESLAFRAALLFAQEYSILAASAEDRPFVPACSAVICSKNASGIKKKDEVPDIMRHAFRKWDDGFVRECRAIPLTLALEALGEQR